MILKERLRELRKEKNLLQKEIAELLKVGVSTYSSYEQGAAKPPVDSVVFLARFYDVSTDYILGVTDIRYNQDELDFYNELKEKNIDQLIHDYNTTLGDEAMDEKQERVLIRLIKSFMEEE